MSPSYGRYAVPQDDAGPRGAKVWDLLLDIDIVDGPFLIAMYVIASAFFVYLLGRGDGWSWVLTVIVLLIVGAMIGAAALWMGANLLGLSRRVAIGRAGAVPRAEHLVGDGRVDRRGGGVGGDRRSRAGQREDPAGFERLWHGGRR